MGNVSSNADTEDSPIISTSKPSNKDEMDKLNLSEIDESKSKLKENKKTRKTKEYKQLRKMARAGIDNERRFELWQKATNALSEYASMYDEIAKELFSDIDMNKFPQFPLFGSDCKFKRLSTAKLLHSSQRILLILCIEHDSLKYIHIEQKVHAYFSHQDIAYIVELMLLDKNSTENNVFSICHSMLVASKRNNWYFRTDFFNSYVRIKTAIQIFEDNASSMTTHLKEHQMDISNLFGDAISSMYVEYLNEATYLRVFDCFTVEGYKILFRVGVALINYAQPQLLKCKTLQSFKAVLIKESHKLNADDLCTKAFKIFMQRNKFEKLDKAQREKGFDERYLTKIEEETYVRRWPSWNKEILQKSQILTEKVQFIQLWVWLPPGSHIGDYKLLFSTNSDGYKLSELYLKCRECMNLIVVIKTTKNEIFGVYVSQFDDPMEIDKFAPLNKRIKDPKILLFALQSAKEEVAKCYFAQNADHFYHRSKFELKNMHSTTDLDMDEVETDLIEIINEEQKEQIDAAKIPMVFASKDALIIGDESSDCLFLDNDLNYGFSNKSETFGCPSMVDSKDGQFQIAQVEVWCVD